MGFQLSPGVQVQETDRTNTIPAVSASIGGYAGVMNWGPCNEATLVSSESELLSNFGTPTKTLANSFETAASFLKYGNALYVSRAIDTTSSAPALNSKSDAGTTARSILNLDAFESLALAATDKVYARYPGAMGDSIKVEFAFAAWNAGSFATAAYDDLLNSTPGTSDAAAAAGITLDEVSIIVIDAGGLISGVADTVLEIYENLSVLSDVKDESGSSAYFEDVITRDSQYIYANGVSFADVFTDTVAGETIAEIVGAQTIPYVIGTPSAVADADIAFTLTSGADGDILDPSTVVTALGVYSDGDTIDISLLFAQAFAATADQATVSTELTAIVAARKDALAFLSPHLDANTVALVKTHQDTNASSSYIVLDSSSGYVYDKYNDQFVYIPLCGHIAGLCAETDNVADSWFSPAGYNRGQLRGVIKLKVNPTKAERDLLYKARVNPIVAFPGQGIVLFGDKTGLAKPSAFDRINVRRLFIVLEKAIASAAKFQLFELNDEFTRAMFRSMVEPFLRDVQGRRGVTDFLVVCDETNNTSEVIDNNRFVGDIYIQPARSINNIKLNFIATRTGVDFAEQVGASNA